MMRREIKKKKKFLRGNFFLFEREFQFMTFAPDNSFLSSDQDTNNFLV